MRILATAIQAFHSLRGLLIPAALLAATLPGFAQPRLQLSADADFSTADHVFTDGETIHIRVHTRVGLDFSAVTESNFEVKPLGDGEDFEGTLALQDDGSFTGHVDVSALGGNSAAWQVSVEIEDEFDREFKARTAITIRGRGEHPMTVRVSGLVEAASSDEITVDGRVIAVTEDTEIDGRVDSAEELLGKHVVLVARRNSDGSLTALRIVLRGDRHDDDDDEDEGDDDAGEEDDEDDDEVGDSSHEIVIRGEITAIEDDGWVTIGSTTFLVTDDTRIKGERGQVLTPADVAVGMFARAHLLTNDDGSLTAFRLRLEERFEDDDVQITGRIEAVSETEITVHGMTFAISESTEIDGYSDEDLSVADLRVGMIARVEGEREDGVLVATEIKVRGRIHHEGRLSGLVTATGDGTIVVNGVTITANEETIVGGAASFADIVVGQRVQVHFRRLADGTLIALRIRVPAELGAETEISGAVESIGGETIVVAGVTVHVNALTVILDHDKNAVTLADLGVGQTVEVEGVQAGEGIVAVKIKVEDAVVISGLVISQDRTAVRVGGTLFAVSGETLIIDRNNMELGISDLRTGAYVEVLAVGREASAGKSVESAMQAHRILVLQRSTSTGIDEESLPSALLLLQNYPNPFNPSTTIAFEIGRLDGGDVTLAVYNLLGQRVRTLVAGALPAGAYTFEWNGRDDKGRMLSSGVYLYRLDAAGRTATRSMTLMK